MKFFKSRKSIVIFFITAIFFICIRYNIIDISVLANKESTDIHFDLITVNSVFAGFLFSSLTLLIGLSDTKTVITLERANYMDRIYKNIINGLISSLVSIILSLICIFILPNIKLLSYVTEKSFLKLIINEWIPGLVLIFIIFTITSFLIATSDVKFIISSIRRKSIKNAPTEDSIKKTLESIK